MNIADYRKAVAEKIDGYLTGELTAEDVSSWAEQIVISEHIERFPRELTSAIHALFDLHDKDAKWMPGHEELRRYKEQLSETDKQ